MPQLLIFFGDFFVGVSEANLDGENSVRRRSRKKSTPESGAREHKEQLQKLSEKVGFAAFYKYLMCVSVFICGCEISFRIKVQSRC